MATTRRSSEIFERFVVANQHRFPLTVIASTGVYGKTTDEDVSNGDIMRLLSVKERFKAEFEHPVTSEWVQVDVPPDFPGGFLTVSPYGPDHVYLSVAEIAYDFPTSVRVLEDVRIQGMLVKKGEGLKLKYVETGKETSKRYLHCLHYPSDIDLLVPFEVKGRFSRREDYTIYTLSDLKDRMPVWVKRERNEGLQIRGYSKSIPGIPDDFYGTLYLTKTTYVKTEQWDDPGPSGFYDVNAKQDKCIPISLGFTVTPADGIEAAHGAPEPLLDIARSASDGHPVFARGTGQKALDELDLPADTILVVHGIERRKGLVVKGLSSHFLIPKNYKNSTLFKINGTEYTTPYDLWKSKYMGPVNATQTVRAPLHFREVRSIYKHDELHLARKPNENEELPQLVSSGGVDDEIDIVELVRTKSLADAPLGGIYAPSYVKVHLQVPAPSLGEHAIGAVVKHGTLPMSVSLSKISSGATLTSDDNLLVKESPLEILAERDYSVIHVTLFDQLRANPSTREKQEAREVPDFLGIRARRISGRLPTTKDRLGYRKPENARLYRLSLTQFSVLYEVDDEDTDDGNTYEDPDINTRRRRSSSDQPPLPPRSPDQLAQDYPVMPPGAAPRGTPGRSVVGKRHGLLPALPGESKPRKKPPATKPKPKSRPGNNDEDLLKRKIVINKPTPRPRLYAPMSPISKTPPPFKMETIPTLTPPTGGDISNHDMLQIAGIFRHLGFAERTLETCLQKEINGAKLCRMKDLTDDELKHELKLENNSQLYSIKHLMSRAESAYLTPTPVSPHRQQPGLYHEVYEVAAIPEIKPPEDGNIGNFDKIQIAGLFRHLKVPETSVEACLLRKITGAKLCSMTQKELQQELKLQENSHPIYAIKHFVSRSKFAETIPEKKPPDDGNIRHFSVKEIAGLMRYLKLKETAVNNCLAKQVDGEKLCQLGADMEDEELIGELQIGPSEIFALKHFITMSVSENNNDAKAD